MAELILVTTKTSMVIGELQKQKKVIDDPSCIMYLQKLPIYVNAFF